MDHRDLEKFNGKDGAKTYVAVSGQVYDVTESPKWKDGKHMMRHEAGQDLTTDLKAAPHGMEVFEKFNKVDTCEEKAESGINAPWPLSWIYANFPIVKRHAHPVSVHYPIAFFMGAFLCCLIYLFTHHRAFDTTGFHLVILGALTAPFAIITGFQSWWLYYGMKMTRGILLKLILGPTLILFGIIAAYLHIINPNLLAVGGPMAWLYILLLGATVPIAGTLGYIGGQMTFPD